MIYLKGKKVTKAYKISQNMKKYCVIVSSLQASKFLNLSRMSTQYSNLSRVFADLALN